MKLDRNLNGDGRGKYGLVNNRELVKRADEAKACAAASRAPNASELEAMEIVNAVNFLEAMGIVDWGTTPETEFFVMRLRDKYAGNALYHYGSYAISDGQVEYGQDVMDLMRRSGTNHPNFKVPD